MKREAIYGYNECCHLCRLPRQQIQPILPAPAIIPVEERAENWTPLQDLTRGLLCKNGDKAS